MDDINNDKLGEIGSFLDGTLNRNREDDDRVCYVTALFIPQKDGSSSVHFVSNTNEEQMSLALKTSVKAFDKSRKPEPADPIAAHNETVKDMLLVLMDEPLKSGGMGNVLTVLESVVTGVVLTNVKYGGSDKVLDLLYEAVKKRIGQQALADSPAAGNA